MVPYCRTEIHHSDFCAIQASLSYALLQCTVNVAWRETAPKSALQLG